MTSSRFAATSAFSLGCLPSNTLLGTESLRSSTTRGPAMPNDLRVSSCAHTPPYRPSAAPTTASGLPLSALSPNGRWIATGSYNIPTRPYEFPSLRQVAEFTSLLAQSPDVAFTPDSRTIYTLRDRQICTWEIPAALVAAPK